MTDNEIMSIKKAMFILRHGSAEGEHKYFEAIEIIEKEYYRQKAEIERLTHYLEAMAQTMPNMAKAERAEAIKEYAERLKEETIDVDVSFGYGREHYTEAVTTIAIDNLVKEMTGGI